MSLITAESFLAFLSYFATGIGMLIAAAAIVVLLTPHREFTLIRQGNTAASIAFAGMLIGLALPLQAAIRHSVSLPDAAIWGAVAAVVQVIAYLLARLVVPGISRHIADGVIASGVVAASIAIAIGLLNAAAITP